MENQTKENQMMYTGAIVAATIFIAVAYNLPTEKFFAVFAAGLFLIPALLFIYLHCYLYTMVQKVAGK